MGLDEGKYFVDQPTHDGERQQCKRADKENRALDAGERMRAGVHHAENHGEQNPAHEIVEHCRGHNDGSHLRPQEIEIHQNFGDHRKSRNGKRRTHKQRENQPACARRCAQVLRDRDGGQKTQAEGNDHSEEADEEGALALAKNAAQVDFEAGGEEKEYDAEGRNGLEHDGHEARAGKQRRVDLRPEMAEHGGTQQNSGEYFAQNGRLSQLLHQFAGELRGTQKGGERQEHDHYVVLGQVRHAEPLLF